MKREEKYLKFLREMFKFEEKYWKQNEKYLKLEAERQKGSHSNRHNETIRVEYSKSILHKKSKEDKTVMKLPWSTNTSIAHNDF